MPLDHGRAKEEKTLNQQAQNSRIFKRNYTLPTSIINSSYKKHERVRTLRPSYIHYKTCQCAYTALLRGVRVISVAAEQQKSYIF